MASTTVEPQSADSTKDKEVNVSSSSEEREQGQSTSQETEDAEVHSTQIKNNQQIRTERSSSHQSDDDDDDDDEDSNEVGDEATSTTGPSNNGFHDESSGGSTSSGSRIPIYSGGSSTNLFNAPICSPLAPFQSSGSKSNPFSAVAASSTMQQQHRPILRPSSFKFSTGSPTQTNLIGSSSLTTSSSAPASSAFVLRPPKLNPGSSTAAPTTAKPPVQEDESVQQTPTFVPLEMEAPPVATETPAPESIEKKTESEVARTEGSTAAAASFVFGSNLSDRVIPSDVVSSSSSGVKRKIGEDDENKDLVKKPSVAEEQAPLLPQQVITGEEDEVNVLQIQCRLFIFDAATGSWVERGRGSLRLNDSKDSQPTSRLIIRTKGSLRVMLNTKVWEGMRVEKAGDKSVRIMAVDLDDDNSSAGNSATASDGSSGLRIFLIMATSVSDATTLLSALESRVRRIISQDEAKN